MIQKRRRKFSSLVVVVIGISIIVISNGFITIRQKGRTENFIANERKDSSDTRRDSSILDYTKSHSLSVCLVPPSPIKMTYFIANDHNNGNNNQIDMIDQDYIVWETISKLRFQLRDPGMFRWPPHVNLLYPFVKNVNENNRISESTITSRLRDAARQVEPFWVSFDLTSPGSGLGTFGSASRGVLWAYPKSFYNNPEENSEPIVALQALLESEFPMCSESLKDRQFLPHMTLSSNFDSIDDANTAADTVAKNMTYTESTNISFRCKELYLLERDGDDGQFERRATISLGTRNDCGIQIHDPPIKFCAMPSLEDNWLKEERMALKEKRRKNHNNRRGRSRLSYRARKRMKREAEKENLLLGD